MSDSEDDVPLSKRVQPAPKQDPAEPRSTTNNNEEEDEDDLPLSRRFVVSTTHASSSSDHEDGEISTNGGAKRGLKGSSDDEDDDDLPLAKRIKVKNENGVKAEKDVKAEKNGTKANGSSTSKKAAAKYEPKKTKKESAVKGEPKATTTRKRKEPAADASPKKSKKSKKDSEANGDGGDGEGEGDDEDEMNKWWETFGSQEDNSVKWSTLEHNGPYFAPPYVPHGIKMLYDGNEIELHPEAEEVATFWAELINSDHAKKETFRKNFFADFLEVVKKHQKKSPIKSFDKCDFTPIVEHVEALREKKKNRTKEEKAIEKVEKKKVEDQYGWAFLDGRKEKIGAFRTEPPGLFRGRGEHPKTGKLKKRVMPEQITINIGESAKIPDPPPGHQWGEVRHDNTVTWLATWKENVNNQTKYVFLAADSSLKGQSDMAKFEKARGLKEHIDAIRKDYTDDLKSKDTKTRQRATAIYLIDKLALRAGNEKSEDEADTVGCCSLRVEHITLHSPNEVEFDFLGKDSIRYTNTVKVDAQVFTNLKIFKKPPKKPDDELFDWITPNDLNKYLTSFMKGLTAKVFRTYNASWTFQDQLDKLTPENGTIQEKILSYNRANRMVAILCNHQRAAPKTAGQTMKRMRDKVRALKLEKQKIKEAILELDPKAARAHPEVAEPESDLDDEWIQEHLIATKEKEVKDLEKKLVKENEKRAENGEKAFASVEEMVAELGKKEKREVSVSSVEKGMEKLAKMDERIKAENLKMTDKEENMTTSLSTSKTNYIDPRITVAWCNKYSVPVEKMFNGTLRKKFHWALHCADEDWRF
ncbi:hypothetical protein BJ742DRAFT_843064 [Cladochytrium replicatum]|nr:hypothetical protein BJ742DRAFT_843064 [Cladochytrium replicatum]